MNENEKLAVAMTTITELTPEMEEALESMTIRQQLWKVSPEVNMIVFKNFLKKHRPDLNWLVPIGAFGVAVYLVKSGHIDLKKIEKFSDEKLGITIDPNGVKKFAANVSIASVVFAGTKVVGKMFSKKDKEENIFKEISLKGLSFSNIDDAIDEFKGLKGWKPKAEELLPISLSVIALAIISKPVKEIKALTWLKNQFFSVFGSLAFTTVSEAIDNAVLMLTAKLNLDVSEEEDLAKIKKFIILAVIATILLVTYGRSISKDDSKKKALSSFFTQLLAGMKKMAPAVFATIVAVLVEKNVISEVDIPDEILEDMKEVEEESSAEKVETEGEKVVSTEVEKTETAEAVKSENTEGKEQLQM